MTQSLPIALVVSLVLTVAIEVAFFFLIGKRNRKDLLLLVLVNVITNPLVVLLYWVTVLFTNIDSFLALVVLETLAVGVEGRYYQAYGIDFRQPYVFSLAANVVSFGIGVLLQYLF